MKMKIKENGVIYEGEPKELLEFLKLHAEEVTPEVTKVTEVTPEQNYFSVLDETEIEEKTEEKKEKSSSQKAFYNKVYDLYINKGMSQTSVAEELGMDFIFIKNFIKKNGLSRKSVDKQKITNDSLEKAMELAKKDYI